MSGTKGLCSTFITAYATITSCMLNAARVYGWNEWRFYILYSALCSWPWSKESVQLCWRLTKPSGRSGMFFSWGSVIDYVIALRLSGTPGPSCMFHRTGEVLQTWRPAAATNFNGSPAIALGETDAEAAGCSSWSCQRPPVARKPERRQPHWFRKLPGRNQSHIDVRFLTSGQRGTRMSLETN